MKAKCSFIIFQLSLLRKWDLKKLCFECLSPFPPTHLQWFWTSRRVSNILDREGDVSNVLQITHSMKIYARLRGKSQLMPTRRKLRKRTLLLDFGKPSWEKDVGNHASLTWQLRELLVSPNFMIITEYAYKLPPVNCLLFVGLGIQLLRFLIREKILLWQYSKLKVGFIKAKKPWPLWRVSKHKKFHASWRLLLCFPARTLTSWYITSIRIWNLLRSELWL